MTPMSGGLLEKAKQVTGDDDDVDAAADAVIEIETVPNPLTFPLMKYVAIGTLLLSMILIYMLSSLPDFSGFVVLIIFLASFGAAWMHVKNERNGGIKPNPLQITALVVAYLLLGGAPYVGAMDFGGQTTLTEVTYDEASDSVLLEMRYTPGLFGGSFGSGDVDVEVLHDGASVWSGTISVTMSESSQGGEIGSFTLDVDDFYSGNANYVTGSTDNTPQLSEHKYEVVASIAGSDSISAFLPSLNMTRTVNDVDVFIDPWEDGENCPGGHDSCVQRLYMTGWVGISSESQDSNSVPGAVRGDYSIDIDFTYVDGDSLMVDYPTISVVGTHATWDSGNFGTGISTIGERTTAFSIEGEEQDNVGRWYFDRDTALDDYGCYRLDFNVIQSGPDAAGGTGYTMPPAFYLYEDHHQDGEGLDEDTDWETFEAVASC
ncbi:MAG: hypothetical protein VX230_05400 [Candidatus Thermoplasmatota archaeon]|nr:hypothetical protein [Candidatus Thermoplasmatota archaeon]